MSFLESRIRRLSLQLGPNPRRVLLRPFLPSLIVKPLTAPEPHQRVANLFSRVMLLEEADVEIKLGEVMAEFTDRHQRIREIFLNRFDQIRSFLPTDRELSESRRTLLGSYFMNEYSLESSALFNPSMVASPDQSGLPEGHLRFILSLRATGEGHVSSITFRSGVVSCTGEIRMDPVSRYVHQPRPQPAAEYNLALFRRKLQELGLDPTLIQAFSQDLPECFLMEDLVRTVKRVRAGRDRVEIRRTAERALLLAQSNYTVRFADGLDISEKIIFPYAQNESNGIEDARFVRFTEDDGTVVYYATYTAYDGSIVLPQMVETFDFQEFRMSTLNGAAVLNKGLALFPRRIRGRYVMLGRQDGENIHLMDSDHPHFWSSSRVILRPAEPWEFVQLGNCGSPIETPEGWLVITHGVGAMRKYCIGAVLLDRDDPSRVLGRLREPLLYPSPNEREGYVPNVVYSCGSLIHAGHLILPYAVSDTASRFAVVPLADLLQALRAS